MYSRQQLDILCVQTLVANNSVSHSGHLSPTYSTPCGLIGINHFRDRRGTACDKCDLHVPPTSSGLLCKAPIYRHSHHLHPACLCFCLDFALVCVSSKLWLLDLKATFIPRLVSFQTKRFKRWLLRLRGVKSSESQIVPAEHSLLDQRTNQGPLVLQTW